MENGIQVKVFQKECSIFPHHSIILFVLRIVSKIRRRKKKKKKRKKEECLSRCPGYRGLVIEMINQNLLDTVVGLFVI